MEKFRRSTLESDSRCVSHATKIKQKFANVIGSPMIVK